MTRIKFRIAFIIGICCAMAIISDAQKEVKTEDGRTIIIMPDGSWEYKTTTDVENEMEATSDTIKSVLVDDSDLSVFEIPSRNSLDPLDQEAQMISFYKSEIVRLMPIISEDLMMKMGTYSILRDEYNIAKKGDDKQEREYLKEEVDDLKDEIKSHENKLSSLNKIERKLYETETKKARDIQKDLKKIKKDMLEKFGVVWGVNGSSKESIENFFFELEEKKSQHELQCNILYDAEDQSLGQYRKEIAPVYFFAYTHPKLKAHLKEKNFLNCNAALVEVDGNKFLKLEVRIDSDEAKKSYGGIDREALLRIQLINGEVVILNSSNKDGGIIEPYSGDTIYDLIYPLPNGEAKKLSKTEVDNVGIMWNTGFEEYEVYEIDALMNQMKCLKS